MLPLPPPGWYGDPDNAGWLRWWDGRTWTDRRAAVAESEQPARSLHWQAHAAPSGNAASPPMYATPSTPGAQRPGPLSGVAGHWRRIPLWARLALVAAAVAVVVVGVVVARMPSSENKTLACEVVSGNQAPPPQDMTVQRIDVEQHGPVTALTVRFAGPMPALPVFTSNGKRGYDIEFSVSNGDAPAFTDVGPDPGGGYGFMSWNQPFTNTANVTQGNKTYVRQLDSETLVISMDRVDFGVDNDIMDPRVVVKTSAFGGPDEMFDDQACR